MGDIIIRKRGRSIMAYKSASEFTAKNKDGSLVFTLKGKELLAYVPEKYFDRNIAEQEGEYINLLGIFDYTIQDLKTGKTEPLRAFNLPTMFSTKPYTIEKVKQIKLKDYTPEMDYRVFRYQKDDILMVSTSLVEFIGNVEKMNNLFFILGFIINTIPYDKLYEYVLNATKLNGFSYGITNQVIGFVLSEVCRAKDNTNIPWRLGKSDNLHDYESMSLKGVSKLISPYTALLSEDFDESILYAMMNEHPKESALEKVLVGQTGTLSNE
jgi:hypothetical protein